MKSTGKAKRTLLIDGDVIIYTAAAGAEEVVNWGDGLWTLHSFEEPAKKKLDQLLAGLKEKLEASHLIIAFSDKVNWRKCVLPSYKANRKYTRKPMLLSVLREYVEEKYTTVVMKNLEADDVLGILATQSSEDEKVIVTIDKDLKTIPCKLYLMHKPEEGIQTISEEEADKYHFIQTLAGDATDGYSGCPNIGMNTAKELLDSLTGFEPYDHTFKSGKRAGETERRWKKVTMGNQWDVVTSCFNKQGMSEEEAFVQYKMARILRDGEYDMKTGRVIL